MITSIRLRTLCPSREPDVSARGSLKYRMNIGVFRIFLVYRFTLASSPTVPSMDHPSHQTETTLLVTHHQYTKPSTKFPLGLVSETCRPYLELIRIEKVLSRSEGFRRKLIRGAADGDHPDVLAIRYAAIQVQIPLRLICISAWGLTMAAYTTGLPLSAYSTSLTKALVGAFLLRSSACTINDIFDREMDAGVG
jgi:4-hydroxybenzoate polyprenyltransferase